MKHIDKNSLKHFGICLLLSLIGGYGAAFALGASLCKEWRDKASYGHWCWLDLVRLRKWDGSALVDIQKCELLKFSGKPEA